MKSCFLPLLLVIRGTVATEDEQQYFRIYNGRNCDLDTLLHNITDFDFVPVNYTSLSLQVNGLWRTVQCVNTICSHQFPTIVYGEGVCIKYILQRNTTLLLVDRFGDPDQDLQKFYLYTSPNLEGESTSVVWHSVFESGLTLRSFFFTGNHTWSLFSDFNFNGSVTCLVPSFSGRNYGTTYRVDYEKVIMSVKYGDYCSSTYSASTSISQGFIFLYLFILITIGVLV